MSFKKKMAEYYNELCDAFGIGKPCQILKGLAILDKIVEAAKEEGVREATNDLADIMSGKNWERT